MPQRGENNEGLTPHRFVFSRIYHSLISWRRSIRIRITTKLIKRIVSPPFSFTRLVRPASYDSISEYINPRPHTPKVPEIFKNLKNQRPYKREQDKRMEEKRDWALSQGIAYLAHGLVAAENQKKTHKQNTKKKYRKYSILNLRTLLQLHTRRKETALETLACLTGSALIILRTLPFKTPNIYHIFTGCWIHI